MYDFLRSFWNSIFYFTIVYWNTCPGSKELFILTLKTLGVSGIFESQETSRTGYTVLKYIIDCSLVERRNWYVKTVLHILTDDLKFIFKSECLSSSNHGFFLFFPSFPMIM